MTSPSITENGEGHFLTQDAMEWFYRQYLPGGVPADTEANLFMPMWTGRPCRRDRGRIRSAAR